MPRILVCYKWVLDEQDIKIAPENLSLDTSRAKYKISDYDKNAIETAVQIAEQEGGNVDALTFGTTAVKQSFKDVLSRGPEKVYYIADAVAGNADAYVTANVLAAAIRKTGPYDLIVCAEGSADIYNRQIASRLAVLLGIPAVTFVNQVKLENSQVIATRKLENCIEIVTVKGPAVISVFPEIYEARIPSLKQVLAAAKKPSQELKIADLELAEEELVPKTVRLSTKGFFMNRKNIIFNEADQANNVAQLVAHLSKEGLA
ncbi:MAG: electron transfer flavoprotein subunit beta/FixA family protein [Syntrophomonadaceae bacterium]|jgi:electron transfer flavoprotein beta subunit